MQNKFGMESAGKCTGMSESHHTSFGPRVFGSSCASAGPWIRAPLIDCSGADACSLSFGEFSSVNAPTCQGLTTHFQIRAFTPISCPNFDAEIRPSNALTDPRKLAFPHSLPLPLPLLLHLLLLSPPSPFRFKLESSPSNSISVPLCLSVSLSLPVSVSPSQLPSFAELD